MTLEKSTNFESTDIAIIGLAGRFPRAKILMNFGKIYP